MDLISHLVWSYFLFSKNSEWSKTFLVLFIAILPDLPWFHYFWWKLNKTKEFLSIFKNSNQEVISYIRNHQPRIFKLRHSLVFWVFFSFLLAIFFYNYLFLSLVYLFHITIDILTHSKERGPEIFYPFSEFRFSGLEFEDYPLIVILSYVLWILLIFLSF